MLADMGAYARGIRGWLRDEDDDEAIAAGRNIAEVFTMARKYMSGGEKG